jgi:hypothetical protein
MGAFYGSVYFRTEDRDAVRRTLEQVAQKPRCRFLLGPALGGWVAAYPEMHGQDERVVKAVVKHFPGEALHVLVHDSDIFAYGFYRNGEPVDEYNSCPDYFEEAPPHVKEACRGRPERLAHLLAPGKTLAELEGLLSEEAERPLFADDLLRDFAELLGLPNALTSYEYLKAGETDDTEGWDQFQHVPDDSGEKARKREAEESIERVKERMRAEGLLRLEKAADEGGLVPAVPVWCPDREGSGFLAIWSRLGAGASPAALERYAPPWEGPAATELKLQGMPQNLVLSPSGRYLAADGYLPEWKMRLWDLDTRSVVADTAQHRGATWVGFSPDEQFLILLCPTGQAVGEGVILKLPGGRRVTSFPVPNVQRAAVHPSGVLLVADPLGRLTLLDLPSGSVRKTLFVGGRHDLGPLHQAFAAQAQQAMAQMDPDALEQQMRAGMEKQIKHVEQAVRRGPLPPGMTAEKFIEAFKQQMEKTIAQMRQQFEQRKQAGAGAVAVPERGKETVSCLECSADGRLVFAGTDQGVRVFSWDGVTAATESTPLPLFTAEAEPVAVEVGHGMTTTQRMVYALAHDAAGNRLLFGGLEGKARFLDLVTGRCGTLLDPPGRPALQRLGLSRDRGALCCTCQPDLFAQGRQRRPALLQVWNYAALEQRLVGG